MFVTIIAQHRCIVNINAIVLLTLYQKYYGEKLLYQRSTYVPCRFCLLFQDQSLEQRCIADVNAFVAVEIKLCGDFRRFKRLFGQQSRLSCAAV